jgi:uncharacterized FlaG/YvyC family protein
MDKISFSPVTVGQAQQVQPAFTTTTSDERAFNFSVATAVRQVNGAGLAGAGREVTFSIDAATHQPVVKVIDSQTKEVIDQWPPKYLLDLAADNEIQTKDSR